jgi:hypothetical protein
MIERVVHLQRKGNEVCADAEINGLPEAQDAGEAPDKIDAERKNGETKKAAQQRHHVAVGAVVRVGADGQHHRNAPDERPIWDEGRYFPDTTSRRNLAWPAEYCYRHLFNIRCSWSACRPQRRS